MLNYNLLEALAAVVEQGSFERAGDSLNLTQSAVSQRIKLLEARLGQPVLTRAPVLKPTALGTRLLHHVTQVQLLEQDLKSEIPIFGRDQTRLRVTLNADSLATWWLSAICDYCREQGILLDLVIEDQDVGLRRMRAGEVAACLCSSEQAVQGARCVYLDGIAYRAYARADYLAQYFPDGLTSGALASAPAVVFGPNDRLHERFLEEVGYGGYYPYHLCPSSEGLVKMVLSGLGYGLLPELQVVDEVRSGRLVHFATEHVIEVPLYWHYWRQGGNLLEGVTRQLLGAVPFRHESDIPRESAAG